MPKLGIISIIYHLKNWNNVRIIHITSIDNWLKELTPKRTYYISLVSWETLILKYHTKKCSQTYKSWRTQPEGTILNIWKCQVKWRKSKGWKVPRSKVMSTQNQLTLMQSNRLETKTIYPKYLKRKTIKVPKTCTISIQFNHMSHLNLIIILPRKPKRNPHMILIWTNLWTHISWLLKWAADQTKCFSPPVR